MRLRVVLLVLACGCGEPPDAPARTAEAAPTGPAAAAPAPAAPAEVGSEKPVADPTAQVCAAAEREGGSLRWFRDDYPAALACARAKAVPLVLDLWAPWCHTCLSMQAYVLTDERFADYDRRFVFLALDTDREENAAAVDKFPPAAWPTFFVVSPTDESIQARYVGAASVDQFASFLDDGERGHQSRAGTLAPADAAAREGDRAAAAEDWPNAASAYARAIASAPETWPRRADVLVSWIAATARSKDHARCAELALAHLDHTGNSASASDFAAHALGCAGELENDTRTTGQIRERVVTRLSTLTADPAAMLSVDDRSDALMYLRQAQEALGRKDEARATAQRQRTLLDTTVASLATARERMTYNWPRAEVFAYLGVPLELVPDLERSCRDLPQEYDPPYRLAWIYREAGNFEQARIWAEKAEALAYGPRKARVQGLLADIHHARGDASAELAARRAVVATWNGLPEAARNPTAMAKATAELAKLETPAAARP